MNAITEIKSGATASFDIDSAADILNVIANWQADLLDRIRRALLIFELHDSETDIQPLIEEAAAFKRVCRCLAWRGDVQ